MKHNGTRRLFAALLALVMVLALLPVGAAKADERYLFVGDTNIDLSKNGSYCDGKVVFEIIDGKNVLTLNDYKLENYNSSGISADGIDLTIVGSAEIGVTGATTSAISVYEGNLTLNGDFTLRAQRENGMALFLFGYLTVEGGALDVENTDESGEAINVNSTMTVNGGTVHAKTNGTYAISAYIILNNGERFLLGDEDASEVKIGVPVEHTVTVVDGTADKTSAKAGDTVTITANDAEYGYAFLQWEMLEDVEFAKGDALTTTFRMPDHDVTVTPVYKEILISDIDDQTYTGEEITLTFGRNDLTLDGVDLALINGTDYSLTYANNVNAGTATVTVTFHDRVTKEPDVRMGTKSKTFRIRPASIAAAEIAEIAVQTYQGKALTPEPTVTWNGKVLEKNKDYTLQYFNNVNVGTNPYVTVKGKGNFDENTDVGKSFRINPAPLTITAIDQEYTYNGYQQGEGDTVYEDPAEIAQKVTVEGLQGDDKLTSVILDGDATEPDTYTGRIQPSNAVISNATGTVTGNYEITYVPGTLTINPCNYTITFVDEDGTELQSGKVAYGETPKYTGEEPTKPATAQYTYTFAGWKDENGIEYGLTDDLPAVTGAMSYTAIYTGTVNEYVITFVNEDGTELQSGKVAYGETPEYKGEEPTKAATVQYTYTFAGWTPKIVPVTGEATYTATFTASDRVYTGPEWTWTGFEKAEATFTAVDDTTFTQTLQATITHRTTTAPTCEGEGVETYTAKVTFLGKEYSDDKPKTLEPIRHDWGEPSYEWTDIPDGYEVTATVICKNDATHKITETVAATYAVVTPPTTRADGLGRYTAEFKDEHFATQTKDVAIPMLLPTFYAEDVFATDVLTVRDGKTLYRCDVKVRNVDAAIKAISMQIFLTYDSNALRFVNAETVLTGNTGINDGNGVLSYAWATDEAGVALPDGMTVLSLYFELTNSVAEDTVLPFGFTTSGIGTETGFAYIKDGATQEADPVLTEGGSMTFDMLFGDANCDGAVTAADASLILRALVGLDKLSARGALNADVNSDGKITAADASAILRYLVGLIERLPV